MINIALKFLVDTYNNQREWVDGAIHQMLLGNIAFINPAPIISSSPAGNPSSGSGGANLRMTLVSIDEERSLKNLPHTRRSASGNEYKKPPLYANLYLLVTANYGHEGTQHLQGLEALSQVIAFFKERPILALREYPESLSNDILERYGGLQLEMELQSMSLEEIYHLWGVLGGKILPSVMYRARLVPIEEKRPGKKGEAIHTIRATIPPN